MSARAENGTQPRLGSLPGMPDLLVAEAVSHVAQRSGVEVPLAVDVHVAGGRVMRRAVRFQDPTSSDQQIDMSDRWDERLRLYRDTELLEEQPQSGLGTRLRQGAEVVDGSRAARRCASQDGARLGFMEQLLVDSRFDDDQGSLLVVALEHLRDCVFNRQQCRVTSAGQPVELDGLMVKCGQRHPWVERDMEIALIRHPEPVLGAGADTSEPAATANSADRFLRCERIRVPTAVDPPQLPGLDELAEFGVRDSLSAELCLGEWAS